MASTEDAEVQEIAELQDRITERLNTIGYVGDSDSRGNIIHHLAELAVMGKKLSQEYVPAFLRLPLTEREELAENIVAINYELIEMKEAIEDMEPDLIKLMNFLNR